VKSHLLRQREGGHLAEHDGAHDSEAIQLSHHHASALGYAKVSRYDKLLSVIHRCKG
jgi:hypothetical protein